MLATPLPTRGGEVALASGRVRSSVAAWRLSSRAGAARGGPMCATAPNKLASLTTIIIEPRSVCGCGPPAGREQVGEMQRRARRGGLLLRLALASVGARMGCVAWRGDGSDERFVLRAGESRLLQLVPAVEKGTGKPVYTRVCYEGAPVLHLGLAWHRAELEFTSKADASIFDFESGRDDLRPALLHTLMGFALPLSSGRPLANVHRFSPYGSSCVGVRALASAGTQEVSVRALRRFIWWLPLLLVLGLVLLLRAGVLSERDGFYYATGSSLGVLFGVLFVGFFVVHKLVQRRWPRLLASVALVTGYVGSVYDALAHSAEALVVRYHAWILAYVAVCALLGLVFVHRSVSSANGVPVWWRDVTRWALWLLGAALYFNSTYSTALAVCGAVLVVLGGGVIALLPEELRLAVWAALFDTKAAPRPATTFLASGKWMSEEEYAMQGEIETDRALQELHSSPAFQRWLITNRRRIRLAPEHE